MKKSHLAYIFYKVLLLLVLLVIALIIPLINPVGIISYLRLLIIIITVMESLNLFRVIFIDGNWKKLANMAVVALSIFIAVVTLEIIFMFVPRSHGVGYTLSSKIWFAKYLNPINSLGFRDTEPCLTKPTIFFIGDSFTEGHGLKKIEERFSNIVRQEILNKGYNYSVINLGRRGLDTQGEYNLMLDFIKTNHVIPSKIVLQYYGNDIEVVASENGLAFKGFEPYSDIPKFLANLVKGSYLANYIYWTLPKEDTQSYSEFLINAYENQKIMSIHKKHLRLFIDFSIENSTELSVVVFPFMKSLDLSDTLFVSEVVEFFEDNNVKTINVSQLISNMPLNDRTVNNNDGHASKNVNFLVAKEVLKMIKFE